jgi:hypothetical protein
MNRANRGTAFKVIKMDSFISRSWITYAARSLVILIAILAVGCSRARTSSPISSDQKTETTNNVRAFAAAVATDVTQRGALAWSDHLANTPNFFMASEGHLVFANGEAAMNGIKNLPGIIAHLELRWGEPMLVDALTPELAMVAAPYHEVQVDPAGHRVEENGYFTGLAELGPAGWKFRNAHWSVTAPTTAAR